MKSNIKMLIKSKNAIGTEIASELSGNICAITRRDFSAEMFEKSNAVLIDNTKNDMDESLETLILSEKNDARIFVLTDRTESLVHNRNGVLFISEKLGTENICELICYCMDTGNTHRIVEKTTAKMLLNLGFQVNFKGYRYLIDAILMISENPELVYKFNNTLYPAISEIHDVTPLSVERSIRHSIELTYDRNYRKFEEFFGYKLQKPTNTEFISFCAEKIRLELL